MICHKNHNFIDVSGLRDVTVPCYFVKSQVTVDEKRVQEVPECHGGTLDSTGASRAFQGGFRVVLGIFGGTTWSSSVL